MADRWRYNASRLDLNVAGQKPLLYGGCQLFLDLAQAFDHMPRTSLQPAYSSECSISCGQCSFAVAC